MSAVLREAEERLRNKEERREGLREREGKNKFIPLSYIDDVNSIRLGSMRVMDAALE